MKVYLSGAISGLELDQALANFEKAEDHMKGFGLDPVNPLFNGLERSAAWEDHMIRDIELLMGCEAIYMLSNWMDSRGARIEKCIAVEFGLKILFEDGVSKDASIHMIKHAIEVVTGMCFGSYTKKSRERTPYYARMIFINKVKDHCKFGEISKMVNRDHSTIIHCLKNYENEKKYNKEFRELVEKVENVLNQCVSQ